MQEKGKLGFRKNPFPQALSQSEAENSRLLIRFLGWQCSLRPSAVCLLSSFGASFYTHLFAFPPPIASSAVEAKVRLRIVRLSLGFGGLHAKTLRILGFKSLRIVCVSMCDLNLLGEISSSVKWGWVMVLPPCRVRTEYVNMNLREVIRAGPGTDEHGYMLHNYKMLPWGKLLPGKE